MGPQRRVGQPLAQRSVERLVRIQQRIRAVELERGQPVLLAVPDQPDLGFRAGPEAGAAVRAGDWLEPVR